MAFSIFNKKGEPPPKGPAGKPAPAKPLGARPVPAKPEPEVLSSKIDQIEAEMDSLDFTSPSARPAPAPAPAFDPASAAPPGAAPASSASASGTIYPDFLMPDTQAQPATTVKPTPAPEPAAEPVFDAAAAALGLIPSPPPAAPPSPVPAAKPQPAVQAAPAAKPAPAPAQAAPAKPAPAKSGLLRQGVASVMMMEVEQSPFEAAPVLEEAAILFANGEDPAALQALRDALKAAKLPQAAMRQAWMLLFDLYENLGKRDDFETSAIDFAVAFETSPPAFVDRSGTKDPTLETGGGQYFALTGALDAESSSQFSQLAKTAERNKILRIEFGKITAVAEAGCKLLFEHLRGFKKSGHDLVFSSADHLIKLLNGAIETGRREDPEIFWLLLLELYQFQNLQTAFEESALNYCITYEVSPPSWEEPAKPAVSTAPAGPTSLQIPQDAFYLKGLIGASAGGIEALLKEVADYAADKSLVVIDLFDVRRVDFMSAGAFLNLVTTLHGLGKAIEIRSPSPLVAALFVSMGFMNQVRFTRRGQ